MRHSGNIFKTGNYGGGARPSFSGIQILTMVLSAVSLIAAIAIIVNFDMITARIAVGVANLLSTGLLLLIVIIGVMILIGRWRWRMHRRFWNW